MASLPRLQKFWDDVIGGPIPSSPPKIDDSFLISPRSTLDELTSPRGENSNRHRRSSEIGRNDGFLSRSNSEVEPTSPPPVMRMASLPAGFVNNEFPAAASSNGGSVKHGNVKKYGSLNRTSRPVFDWVKGGY
eukprot:TRINITY_DN60_c0_g1_i3.p1 TRINITY_DN60_c0_g1~~TRINITY_DN60_c0_g1_i3.p1  ORF type:complete len:133 (+),score=18.40 TRINITY_DN60_c0_g1_i3:175-573(+)